jgi:exonuclease SbcC
MLKSIKLFNFQKHRTLKIDLDPGVTTLHGPSDSGKSSLFRAFKWAALNEAPDSFDAFRHWDTDSVSVILDVDDQIVKRKRIEGGLNSYLINGKKYDAVRASIPEPIANLLRMGESNFQDQLSTSFWLSDTPGAVSRNLNKIIDLAQIDESLSRAASEVRSSKTKSDIYRTRAIESKALKSSLAWTDDADADLSELESLESAIRDAQKDIATLSSIRSEIDSIDKAIDESVGVFSAYASLLEFSDQISQLADELEQLGSISDKLKSVERLDGNVFQDFTYLDGLRSEMVKLSQELQELEQIQENLDAEEEDQCQLNQLLQQSNAELKSLSKTHCPECGRGFGSI